jgi:hypothetical protein
MAWVVYEQAWPTFTPMGLLMPRRNSTWAPSS